MSNNNKWNKRIKPKNIDKKNKMNSTFLVRQYSIEEVLDESGEVLDDTVIKINFDGILFYLSISNALKFNKILNDILNLKNK